MSQELLMASSATTGENLRLEPIHWSKKKKKADERKFLQPAIHKASLTSGLHSDQKKKKCKCQLSFDANVGLSLFLSLATERMQVNVFMLTFISV